MAKFKNASGDIIEEDTRKMKIQIDGVTYHRIYAGAYVSRQGRLNTVIQSMLNIEQELGELIEGYKEANIVPSSELLWHVVFNINLDFPEVTRLADELENWKSKLEGTRLANTVKYGDVAKVAQRLREGEAAIDELELPSPSQGTSDYIKRLEHLKSDLGEISLNLGYIYMPTMY